MLLIQRLSIAAGLVTLGATSLMTRASAEDVVIRDFFVAPGVTDAQKTSSTDAARAFYDFWNTGEEAYLNRAISTDFIDHTLPPGRAHGTQGPADASKQFRAAVPDLSVTIDKMVIAGDYVTVHMTFTGHFTGKFGKIRGKGQPVSFIATDLLKMTNGRITDNWHIEDNLTLLKSMDIAKLRQ